MTTPSSLVEIRNLSVDFEAACRFTRALHGIDLTLSRGEVLGIVGEIRLRQVDHLDGGAWPPRPQRSMSAAP